MPAPTSSASTSPAQPSPLNPFPEVGPIADLVRDVNAIARLEGDFLLRSGQRATEYFDKYRFEAEPTLLARVAAHLEPLIPADTEMLAGLELGGVPLATALSLRTGIPAVFVRKEAKTYGTARLAEGGDIEGRRLLVVEDVVTSGGQVAISTGQLRDLGAIVDIALCVIDRSGGEIQALREANVELLSVMTKADLDQANSA